jgi:SPP1 gp7 family putative phage head morphogenesis protein
MPRTRKQKNKKATKKLKASLLALERGYYNEIKRMYRIWFAEVLRRLSRLTRRRFDSKRFDSPISDLFDEMLGIWNQNVQTFTVAIRKRANGIKRLSSIFWNETTGDVVDLAVNPLLAEPWIQPALDSFAEQNVRLITKIGTESISDIQRIVQDGQINGISTKKIAQQLQATKAKFSESRARLIARDQVSKLNGQLTMIRAERAGVEKYEWSDSGDIRVRPKHKAFDDTIRTWDQSPIPGEEINCRCVPIPVIKD